MQKLNRNAQILLYLKSFYLNFIKIFFYDKFFTFKTYIFKKSITIKIKKLLLTLLFLITNLITASASIRESLPTIDKPLAFVQLASVLPTQPTEDLNRSLTQIQSTPNLLASFTYLKMLTFTDNTKRNNTETFRHYKNM